jgi:hypothetical protein
MSIRIPRFFGLDPVIVDEGFVKNLSGASVRLFLFLMRKSDRFSSRQFPASDKEIVEMVGGSASALAVARKKLRISGLIDYNRDTGGLYTYVICDPSTGKPYPGDPRDKVPYTKRKDAKRASIPHPEAFPVPKMTAFKASPGMEEELALDSVEFPFGHNLNTFRSQLTTGHGSLLATSLEEYSPF